MNVIVMGMAMKSNIGGYASRPDDILLRQVSDFMKAVSPFGSVLLDSQVGRVCMVHAGPQSYD